MGTDAFGSGTWLWMRQEGRCGSGRWVWLGQGADDGEWRGATERKVTRRTNIEA